MSQIPRSIRASLGLLVSAVDNVRSTPEKALELPMLVVSSALQVSLRAQQRYAELTSLGDQLLARLRPVPDGPPAWATFDEDTEIEEKFLKPKAEKSRAVQDATAERRAELLEVLEELEGADEAEAELYAPIDATPIDAVHTTDAVDTTDAATYTGPKTISGVAEPQAEQTATSNSPLAPTKRLSKKVPAKKVPVKKISVKAVTVTATAKAVPSVDAESVKAAVAQAAPRKAASAKKLSAPRTGPASAFDNVAE